MGRPGGKYAPLHDHLRGLVKDAWHAQFSEIERILGFALPNSARDYPAWWSNGSRMTQSAAWLDAGYRTGNLNLTGETVWFLRSATASDSERHAPSPVRPARPMPGPPKAAPAVPEAKADRDGPAAGGLDRFATSVSNHQRVTEGFELLTGTLAPFVAQALRSAFGPDWWANAVLAVLHQGQKRGLSLDADDDELTDQLDVAQALILLDVHWNAVFRDRLGREHRSWIKELLSTRNRWAHKGHRDLPDEDAWRALDTMIRVTDAMDVRASNRLRQLAQAIRSRRVHEPTVRCDLRFAWLPVGELRLDSVSKLAFPDVPRRPGLYRFTLVGGARPSLYVGETDNLKRRFDHYRQPGPSQQTNLRINQSFVEELAQGRHALVAVIVDTAWITTEGVERPADLSVKAERVLLEHAAIVRAGAGDVTILNR